MSNISLFRVHFDRWEEERSYAVERYEYVLEENSEKAEQRVIDLYNGSWFQIEIEWSEEISLTRPNVLRCSNEEIRW